MSETPPEPTPDPVPAEESVLASTKKMLGLADDYTAFDLDIKTHINTVFGTLLDLGIGEPDGYFIEDRETTWGSLLGPISKPRLNSVKSYVYLKVRIMFDTPTTSFNIKAVEDQIRELEWRLTNFMEGELWETTRPSIVAPLP